MAGPGHGLPLRGRARATPRRACSTRPTSGRSLPFLDRIEYRIEKETIPNFNKFLQGYYDAGGVIRESFDKVVHEGGLSPEMAARGMRLEKSVDPSDQLPRLQHGRPGGGKLPPVSAVASCGRR